MASLNFFHFECAASLATGHIMEMKSQVFLHIHIAQFDFDSFEAVRPNYFRSCDNVAISKFKNETAHLFGEQLEKKKQVESLSPNIYVISK